MIGDDFHDCGQKFPEIDLDKWEAEAEAEKAIQTGFSFGEIVDQRNDLILTLIAEIRKRDEWIQKQNLELSMCCYCETDLNGNCSYCKIRLINTKKFGKDGK